MPDPVVHAMREVWRHWPGLESVSWFSVQSDGTYPESGVKVPAKPLASEMTEEPVGDDVTIPVRRMPWLVPVGLLEVQVRDKFTDKRGATWVVDRIAFRGLMTRYRVECTQANR